MTNKDAALTWQAKGYAVIPIQTGTKRPLVEWKEYQTRKPTKEEITEWWKQWPDAWVALVGGHDGLVCFDVDDPELAAKLEAKFINHARIEKNRKSGKIHIWLKEKERSKSRSLIPGKADLKGHKAYFLVAPSNDYYLLNTTVTEPMEVPTDKAEGYIGDVLNGEGYEVKAAKEPVANPEDKNLIYHEGDGRNNFATSVAGYLRKLGLSTDQIRQVIVSGLNNNVFADPLAQEEIDSIAYQSAYGWPQGQREHYKQSITNLQPTSTGKYGEGDDLEVRQIPTMTTRELLAKYENLPPAEYLPLLGMNGLIVKGWSHIIAGESKAGKTELLIDLCMRLDEKVLFITEEAPKPWVKKLKDRGNTDMPNVTVAFALGFELEDLLEFIKTSDADVFIVDTTRQLLRLENENDASEVSKKVSAIKALVTHELEKTLILTHHTNKKQGVAAGHEIAGSAAFTGAVDVWLLVKRAKDEPEGSRKREISGRGRDEGDIASVVYEMSEDFVFTVLGAPRDVARDSVKERVAGVLTDKWKTVTDIREMLDPNPAHETVRAALIELAKEGKALREPDINKSNISGVTAYFKANDYLRNNQPPINLQQPPTQEPTLTSNSSTPKGAGNLEVRQKNAQIELGVQNNKELNLQPNLQVGLDAQPPSNLQEPPSEVENPHLLEDVIEVFGKDTQL